MGESTTDAEIHNSNPEMASMVRPDLSAEGGKSRTRRSSRESSNAVTRNTVPISGRSSRVVVEYQDKVHAVPGVSAEGNSIVLARRSSVAATSRSDGVMIIHKMASHALFFFIVSTIAL